MNTKTFAQQARKILLKGVGDKLRYWGFDTRAHVGEGPQAVSGGYVFRGEVYDDPAVPALWQSLRNAVQHKGLVQVAEEAAYTWFNRMMAIRILSKNGYDSAQLEFSEGAGRLPLILQRAQRGAYPFLNAAEKARLQKIIADHSLENEAFAILLIGYCHSHTLLQTVFGSIDDYTELLLPDNILAEEGFLNLLNTTDAISDEEYQKVELIGWLYQFYISEKKDEVFAGFKKNKKAEAADIPAATQIFTPNWIVKYMVQNTVGKLWLDLHPDSPLKADMKYLVEGDTPQYGSPIISEAAQLKLLDPAVGSGHILVEGFDLLYEMYMAEYYPPEEAVESILKNNLFGLDIDKRAAQLAQFALLLKAAARYRDVLKKGLRPHIYAMPEPHLFDRQEVLDLLGKDGIAWADQLSEALHLMQQAQNLGSIMRFELPEVAVEYIRKRWQYFQQASELGFHEKALLPTLNAYLPVLLILCDKYEAVVANPPYMGQKNMNKELKIYLDNDYQSSKSDLMTAFIEKSLALTSQNAFLGIITLDSWMFLPSYKKLRRQIFRYAHISTLVHIGWNCFPEGHLYNRGVTWTMRKSINKEFKGSYINLSNVSALIDKNQLFFKRSKIGHSDFHLKSIKELDSIPDNILGYWISHKIIEHFKTAKRVDSYFESGGRIKTHDNENYLRWFWEISASEIGREKKWLLVENGGESIKWFGNKINVIDWSESAREIYESHGGLNSPKYWNRIGITWTLFSSKNTTFRLKESNCEYTSGSPVVFKKNNISEFYLLAYLNSKYASELIKMLNPTINTTVGDVFNLPILYDTSQSIEVENKSKRNVELSMIDWNNHETARDFHGSPILNDQPNLRHAYEAWQTGVTQDFFQLHANEEELNRIFINIYSLQDELTPEVPLKDITILQEELNGKDLEAIEPQFRAQGADAIALPIRRDVVMQQFLSYLVGLCMGRYRLDKPGLHIAHPAPAAEEIAPYRYNGHAVAIDEDAILPLMGTACEFPDDALQRIKHLLDVIWGPETLTDNLNFLQECLDSDLEKYLVKQFWKDHCRRYKKKPIYWLFSSPGGAFQVLVYMHRMNAFTAERIRDKYLLPHIRHLRGQIHLLEGRATLLSAQDARQLDRLRKDLTECEAYEMMLKDVADRQIVFDLDDGVSRNYQLFEGVVAEIK